MFKYCLASQQDYYALSLQNLVLLINSIQKYFFYFVLQYLIVLAVYFLGFHYVLIALFLQCLRLF